LRVENLCDVLAWSYDLRYSANMAAFGLVLTLQ
jgi:hypothetical protein